MCDDETVPREREPRADEAFEFESYFDRGSGLWSLRRVPTSIPPRHAVDEQADASADAELPVARDRGAP